MYKPTPKPKLQYKTKPEKTSSVLIIQDLIYNPYIFRAAIPFPYTPKALLFIRTNITDFFKRFKDMVTNCGLSDDRKI